MRPRFLIALAFPVATLSCASRVLPPCTSIICTTSQLHGPDVTSHDAVQGDTSAAKDAAVAKDVAKTPDSIATSDAKSQRCARWQADRADRAEGTWTGATATCDAGSIPDSAVANTLKAVNLARFLADLPAVDHDPTLDAHAQACSLLMAANQGLSHAPPPTWACYTAEAADAAQHSNLSSEPAVVSVEDYLIDSGNDDTLGHRRWILANSLGPIGIGGTDGPSCLWVIGGTGKAGKAWTAWPAPGAFPLAAMRDGWNETLDQTGWSIQSDALNLDKAVIHVTSDGNALAVTTRVLKPYYGSEHAIAFTPQGWQSQPGKTYHVEVSGISQGFSYDVQVVDCAK
jgi:uncharacterized protein YkwD